MLILFISKKRFNIPLPGKALGDCREVNLYQDIRFINKLILRKE